jgi:hypothetical protein
MPISKEQALADRIMENFRKSIVSYNSGAPTEPTFEERYKIRRTCDQIILVGCAVMFLCALSEGEPKEKK